MHAGKKTMQAYHRIRSEKVRICDRVRIIRGRKVENYRQDSREDEGRSVDYPIDGMELALMQMRI